MPLKAISVLPSQTAESDGQASCNSREQCISLSFQGVAAGACLPAEQSSTILDELYSLATSAGVVHNIPRRAAPNSPQLTSVGLNATSSKTGSQAVALSPGVAGGFVASNAWSELSDCAICMDALGDETWIRGAPVRTRCGHFFHGMCLRRHLRGHDSQGQASSMCPNCRSANPLQEADYVGGSGTVHVSLTQDVLSRPFNPKSCYRVVAVLCQDLQAVMDSALALSCIVIQPGDGTPVEGEVFPIES